MSQTPQASLSSINGCRIYHEEGGTGDAVVFVHGGFPGLMTALCRSEVQGWTWSWELDFAEGYRFIWYDRRGCYRSSSPPGGYELENQVRDLEQLLDQLGVSCCHVIGSSAGGPISMLLAVAHPSRVRSLVLCGTALDLFPPADRATQAILIYMEAVGRHGPDALLTERPKGTEASLDALWEPEEAEARGVLDTYRCQLAHLVDQAKAIPSEERRRYYDIELQAIRAYMGVNLWAYASHVACPTMVVHGENDRMVPIAWGKQLAEALPGSRLEVITKGSHGLVTRSREVRQLILRFLATMSSNKPTERELRNG